MSDATNSSGSPAPTTAPFPDPYGQAALLLVESLIHALVARSGLSTDEAVSVVESAIEVEQDISDGDGNDPDIETACGHLLSRIAGSLKIDRPYENSAES